MSTNFYDIVFSRGTKYIDTACRNWMRRRDRLINSYVSRMSALSRDTRYQKKCNKLINELEFRIKTFSTMYGKQVEINKHRDIEAQNELVYLECDNFECRYGENSFGVAL